MQSAYISNLSGKFEMEKKGFLDEIEKKKLTNREKKELTKIYTDFYDNELKDIQKGYFFSLPSLNEYIGKIVDEITRKNPDIDKKNLKILLSREDAPNAYTGINGNIKVNYSFLKYMLSEDDLAAILCHEIGHYYLKHPENAIEEHVKTRFSKEVKEEESRIRGLEFNKSSAAEQLLKKIVYNRKKINREEEIKADSIGLLFLKKTSYNQSAMIGLLEKLNKIDIEKDSLTKEDFKKYFSIPNHKFDDSWLELEDISAYQFKKDHYFKWEIDSLKTHPSCEERIKFLKPQLDGIAVTNFNINQNYFQEIIIQAEFEEVRSLYFIKEYGLSMYRALLLYKKYPENDFALKMIAANLEKFKDAKTKKNYGKYILPINPFEQSHSQQLFYTFFDNIGTAEINAFEEYYKNKIKK